MVIHSLPGLLWRFEAEARLPPGSRLICWFYVGLTPATSTDAHLVESGHSKPVSERIRDLNMRHEKDGPANDREPRRSVDLRGFGMLGDGRRFAISVVNLSYDGCKIQTDFALVPNMKFEVTIQGLGGAIEAEVRWHKEGSAGLRFNVETSNQAVETPRQHERVQVTADISLRGAGRPSYRVRIFDLTPAGCGVEFVERPAVGDRLWVKFDFLDAIEGTVRWVDGHYGGLEFARPIFVPVFDHIVSRLKG